MATLRLVLAGLTQDPIIGIISEGKSKQYHCRVLYGDEEVEAEGNFYEFALAACLRNLEVVNAIGINDETWNKLELHGVYEKPIDILILFSDGGYTVLVSFADIKVTSRGGRPLEAIASGLEGYRILREENKRPRSTRLLGP